jgi:arsenate reductase
MKQALPPHAEAGVKRGPMMDVTIFHNPACGTSRNTLALIRHAGIEPVVIEYLRTTSSFSTPCSPIRS